MKFPAPFFAVFSLTFFTFTALARLPQESSTATCRKIRFSHGVENELLDDQEKTRE